MSTEFSNQLSSMFDDVAATIQPRADFGAARAGAATLPLAPVTATPAGGRPRRNVVAAAAAVAFLFAGGAAAYELADDDGTVATLTDDTVADETVTDAVTDTDDGTDGDQGSDDPSTPTTAPSVEPVANGAPAGDDAHHAVERTAKIVTTNWETEPPVVVLEGSAPAGEAIGVFSLAGAADTIAGDDGWRVELALGDLDRAPDVVLIIVEFSGMDDTIHLFLDRPAADEPKVEEPKDEPKVDEPKDEPKVEQPKDEPATVPFAATLAEFRPMNEPPKVLLHGTAAPGTKVIASSAYGEEKAVAGERGGWEMWVYLWGIPWNTTAEIRVTHPASGGVAEFSVTTPAQPEPPKPVEFTAKLVEGGTHEGVVWRRFGGTATPGSIVHASSDYGTATTTVPEHGEWTLKLWLEGAPPASNVGVKIANSASDAVHRFTVETPAAPKAVEFTAKLVEGGTAEGLLWRRFSGTATPGSTVHATSEYGTASATVPEHGEWTLKLWLEGTPPASNVGVHLSNSASDTVHSFTIETPPAAPTVDFTANAAFVECDSTPPYNEYWGTAQPGTVVVISSPYGGAERTAGAGGGWDARVEFPEAPYGEVFIVKVKSLATGQVKEFPMKRIEPVG